MFRDHGLSQELMTFSKWGALDLGMIKIGKTRPQQLGQPRCFGSHFDRVRSYFTPNEGQYFVFVKSEEEEEEDDADGEIGHMEHWTDSEHDWSIGGEDCIFSDQKDVPRNLVKAMCV
nr:hypothetical protein CFP56_04929 [Quercus suber]